MSTPAPCGAPKIRQAVRSDAAVVVSVVATAFHDRDMCRWLVPNATERAEILPAYLRIVVEHALDGHGSVEITPDLAAAAVWLDFPFPDPTHYDDRLLAACGPWTSRFHALEVTIHRTYPTDRGAHSYLAYLAVRPERQGQGLGSALLAHRHAELDELDLAAYVEARSSRSRELYARHGYVDCAEPLVLPDAGGRLSPMWREAQPRQAPDSGRSPRPGRGHRSWSVPRRPRPVPQDRRPEGQDLTPSARAVRPAPALTIARFGQWTARLPSRKGAAR